MEFRTQIGSKAQKITFLTSFDGRDADRLRQAKAAWRRPDVTGVRRG